jgi:flavin-dependent dehydrogenase
LDAAENPHSSPPPTGNLRPSDSRVAADLKLADGSRVGIIGGGPAGAFFGYFLLRLAHQIGLDLVVDIYEPRDFRHSGPRGCNMCGGIVSESLVQHLATEGIALPDDVIQRRIDSYFLHMDVGSVRIETPLHEKRIAAVHRGLGPRGIKVVHAGSFDNFLLDLAVRNGARVLNTRVDRVALVDTRPFVTTQKGDQAGYDLLVGAVGVNTPAMKLFELPGVRYRPPETAKAYICELFLGEDVITRYLGSAMHVFLVNMPRIDFAALIPKGDYVTVCLLGDDVDKPLVERFLHSREVAQVMPPHWVMPDDFCRCSPKISVGSAVRPFGDRVVLVGDCATTRLYKDGIGAAYRTAKAAAVAALFSGISEADFRRHYWPTCRRIRLDNGLGRIVFAVTHEIQRWRFAQQGVWRMVADEQGSEGSRLDMSTVMWDTFTGSAPYRDVFLRAVKPRFIGRLLWDIAAAGRAAQRVKRRGRTIMVRGVLGKVYRDGEVVYYQGELGNCMYVVQQGEVEVLHRRGDKEFSLAVLGPGEFFGEMALFERDVRPATVRAVGDATVLTLEKGNLLRQMHEEPSLAFSLIEQMSKRLRTLEQALVRVGSDLTDLEVE